MTSTPCCPTSTASSTWPGAGRWRARPRRSSRRRRSARSTGPRSRCCAHPMGAWSSWGTPRGTTRTARATYWSESVEPGFSVNPVSDVEALLSYPFMVNALEAGSIVAVMAAVVGWLMVLRRQSFAGHTLSLMSFPGAALAALLGWPLASGYYVFCVGGALAIAGERGARRDRAAE